jgi:mono/diheme cytochrome c family protein
MMSARRGFLLVLLSLVLSAGLLAGCAGLDENATGEEIYNARCASCHRKDLSGGLGPPLGPGSEAVDRPLEYYEITINTGIGRMPSFKSSLSVDQIQRVIDYVKSVQAAG